MAFFNKYPYLDFHELNLDFILHTIKLMDDKIDNFINFNTIKYADPIEWNITSQYQENTVVLDNVNKIAYLSTQPVPAGVLLTDTDYWTPILDLTGFYTGLAELQDQIGDLDDLQTVDRDSLVDAINEVISRLSTLYVTYAANSDLYADGDVITTTGFYTPGTGAGKYVIHENAAAYCIEFGNKYAEYCPDNEILFDALGGDTFTYDPATNPNADIFEIALALGEHIHPQSIIWSSYGLGNLPIVFGPKDYVFTRTIEFVNKHSIRIKGAGSGITSIWCDSITPLFLVKTHTDGYINNNFEFSDFTFDGNNNSQFVKFEDGSAIKFDNVRIMSATIGVELVNVVDVNIDKCDFEGCNKGIEIGGLSTTINVLNSTIARGATGIYYNANTANGLNVKNCIIEYNTYMGMEIFNMPNVSLCDCWVEGNDLRFVDSIVSLINIAPHTDQNNVVAKIIIDRSATSCTTYTNIPTNIVTNGYGLDFQQGCRTYLDGTKYNVDERYILSHTKKFLALDTVAAVAHGFVEITCETGSYLGYFDYDYANSIMTITQISGTLANPNLTGYTIDASNVILDNNFTFKVTL